MLTITLNRNISILFSAVLLLCTVNSQAQKSYFNRVGEQTNEDNSYYYRVAKGGQKYISYYTSNDNKYFEGKIADASSFSEKENTYVGKCIWYYKNKNKKLEKTFDDQGRAQGKSIEYYESGKKHLEITYKNNRIVDNKYIEYDEKGGSAKIFKEQFNNNHNDWDLYESDKGVAKIVDGKLSLTSLTSAGISRYISLYSIASSYSFELKIDISELSSGSKAGIIYGFKDWDNYSFYLITPSAFYVGSVYEGITSMKMDGMYSYDIKKKGNNLLKILSLKGKDVFSINGVMQYKRDSEKLVGSKAGVAVAGKNSVSVDHLIFKEMSQGSSFSSLNPDEDDSNFKASGSGFLFSTSGHILTNHHVVEDANEIVVELPQGGGFKKYAAKVLQVDKGNDLAIIKLKNYSGSPIKFSFKESGNSPMGAEVFTLGYPLALSGMGKTAKFVDGKISSKTGYDGAINSYQTSIPVQPGNSGGPVFNQKGEVVGIVNAKIMGADNVSYAIKINYAKNIIDLLSETVSYPAGKGSIAKLSLEQKIKTLKQYVALIKIK